jgi:glycosyltransferase involved in cell wall biosynthesis
LFRKLQLSNVALCHSSVFHFSNACFGAVLAGVPNVVSIIYSANAFPRPQEHRRYAGVIPGPGLWWHKLRTQIRCVMRASRSVLFATPEHAGKFYSAYELQPRNAWVVPHLGADVNVFRPCEASRTAVRRELGLDDQLCLIMYAARLDEDKGPDILIEALARLPESVWRTSRAVILGEGSMAAELRRRVGELGLNGRVQFIGFRPDLERYLAAADILAAPSRRECFGISLVDAMACGCAAVAARVDGYSTILRDPSVGVLVEPENPAAMSEAILQLLNQPAARAEMGRRARTHVVNHYSSVHVLEMLRELLVPDDGEPKLAQRVSNEMLARYRHEH